MNRSWLSGSTFSLPSAPVATRALGAGEGFVANMGPKTPHPARRFHQPLLHVHADVHHVEAGMPRGHFHRHLRALLLLGDLLEADRYAGHLLEVLHQRLRDVAARTELVVDLDMLALELLPVERRLGADLL